MKRGNVRKMREHKIDITKIKPILQKYKNKKGTLAQALFDKYGAKKIPDIKEEDLNAFYAALKEINTSGE